MMSDHPAPVIVKAPNALAGRRMRARRSGFALLITITLLAFLVLLLVSLASLTRVETQVAANGQQVGQARQNALMALNIALGQLQKFTGPDQRTTARADMNATLANVTNANGRWLGAYGNGAPVDTAYSLKPSQIPATITPNSDSKGSQAKLLNWLVSGNEGTVFDPSLSTMVGTDGHIVGAPPSITYTPASTINLATASATPATADTQALLVGSNSATAQSDYVAAPLVTITAAAGTVPGLTTAASVGRYAWWVGDEGAKARVNLTMASAAQAPQAFVSAQRAGIELVDGKNQVGSTNANDLIGLTAYDPALTTLPNLVSPRQLSMLTPTAATTLPAALKVRFHDLTASSTSVLADAYAGGLKKDLSAILATGGVSPPDDKELFVPDDIIAPATYHFAVPTWGQLRSFAQTTAPAAGLDPRLPTSTQTGIAPVLSYAALGLQYVAPLGDGEGSPIRLAMYPLAILWNPYTVPIRAAKYEFGFVRRYHGKLQLQVNKAGTVYPWTVKETVDMNRGGSLLAFSPGVPRTLADGSADTTYTGNGGYVAGAKPADSYVRFVIDAPDIPAGASLIFTLRGAESGKDYNAPANGKPTNVMTNGLNAIGHVVLNYGATVGPGESGQNFRVCVYGYANPDRNMFYPADSTTHMSGGGGDAYLGQVVSAGPTGFLPSATNDKQWYQALSGSTLSGDGAGNRTGGAYPSGGYPGAGYRNAFLQTAAPLTPATGPTSVMSFSRLFSSASVNTGIFPDVRWIAQSSPRAPYTTHAIADRGINPFNMTGGGGMQTPWQDFVADPTGKRASSGTGLDAGTTVTDTTLFEFRPSTQPLMSIGQMQHADMSLIGDYPSYAIGNSLADPHFRDVPPNFTGMLGQVRRDETSIYNNPSGSDVSPGDQTTNYYDISWLLNRVMWDRYFVSTVPHAGTGTAADTNATAIPSPLPNARHVRYGTPADADLRDADKAAASLLLKGGFNINSTSEQAWRAVLGGINQLAYDPVAATTGSPLQAALPRFAKPTAAANSSNAWQGYRALSDAQIAQLATNIVAEIRNRGPFVSLADFVNRRLVDNTAATSPNDERLKGVLQAALDMTVSGTGATNTAVAPFADTPTYVSGGTYIDPVLMRGGTTSTAPYSSQSAFAPQFLTQADVLSAIGAGLSSRSDTFTIRTYGEAINPVTQGIQGRAWCEAVVQRLPDYMDAVTDANAAAAPTAALNKAMGRRYKIISFRWLSSNDI